MSSPQIQTVADLYAIIERLEVACKANSYAGLSDEIRAALQLGSSGLETLGAIRQIILRNRSEVERLLGQNGREEVTQIVAFVDGAFAR
jgi:hypothetical protein